MVFFLSFYLFFFFFFFLFFIKFCGPKFYCLLSFSSLFYFIYFFFAIRGKNAIMPHLRFGSFALTQNYIWQIKINLL